jgi:hypothetical protein
MVNRNAIGFSVVAALVVSVAVLAQKKDDRRQGEEQRREAGAAQKVVDDVMGGQAAPNDLAASWVRQDFLKATDNKIYVPFAVTIDPSKTTAGTLAFYWRVVPQGATPPVPEGKDGKEPRTVKRPEYPWESISLVSVGSQSAPMRITRSFAVSAGPYDVYVAIKEPTPREKSAPPAKASVIRQTLEVPDFWDGELATSTVIVAERIEPLAAPLTAEQQAERPYALGGVIEIIPAAATKFRKQDELQTYLVIYNTKLDAANKPDVIVEFNFYNRTGGTEKYFNRTAPMNLNAQTLPPQFDATADHQLTAPQGVPLTSFPEGDYRLEIKVTDKIANKSLTRDVNFSVSGS